MILLALAALTATPATLPATLAKARCGDVVILAAGRYPSISAPRLDCPDGSRLTIDASAATITYARIFAASGIDWQGGTFDPPLSQAVAATIDTAKRVRFTGTLITGGRVGLNIVRSESVEAIGNRFDGVRSDGVNVTMSHHVRIIGNHCANFRPIPASYDAAGKLLVDGDHPDCVQVWSQPGTFAVHDIAVIGNTGSGIMQGVFFGRASLLGFDRVTIRGNDMTVAAFNGIVGNDLRGATITGNTVRTVPGARLPGGNRGLIRAWIRAIDGKDVKACGNVVEAWPAGEGTGLCK